MGEKRGEVREGGEQRSREAHEKRMRSVRAKKDGRRQIIFNKTWYKHTQRSKHTVLGRK